MAPNAHVKKALKAMNDLGITDAQVKPVLKNLLTLYDQNWKFIAEDNYRTLADAILDNQESQATEEVKGKEKKGDEAESSAAEADRGKKKALESLEEDEDALDEFVPPLKRLRRRGGEGGSALPLNNPDLGCPSFKEHDEESSTLELASSETGEVKINLSFAPATGGSNLHVHVPTMEEVGRVIEDKCLRSYKILDPNFSVGRFMGDMVSCFLELAKKADITLGKETVEIPWVNEFNSKVPPPFRYIARSYVYQDDEVKFSLGNIRDDQRCSSCCDDCLTPSVACSCATGLTYTKDGLLQKDFLEECISEARNPQRHLLQYCKECPLEKAKNERCKGHLKRKVIKECWINCGCIENCGNRVVQHGIHNKLQVFFTPKGRGWGLRTLEKLPKGAFVCEFAGEILTISELIRRSSVKHTFPVILDAHWGSEEASDKALCLDGMHYGNISRFINHRCSDANLIEIPVHVENMDFHYYHLAFFTTRDIKAMEELTWDYGVEFNDHVYPTLPFHCQCGSEFCRNVKRISKSKKAKKRA